MLSMYPSSLQLHQAIMISVNHISLELQFYSLTNHIEVRIDSQVWKSHGFICGVLPSDLPIVYQIVPFPAVSNLHIPCSEVV